MIKTMLPILLAGLLLAATTTSIYGQTPEESLWPEDQADLDLGQISGVDVDAYGNVHIFHRGDHVWGPGAFDGNGNYLQKSNGPIKAFTMLTFDPQQGEVLQRRGANRFYMPHGLTIDKEDNVWVTDVAMHQVFKLGPQGDEPLMIMGKAFQPSSGQDGFCQPTDVAVGAKGEIYVTDGYCNARVVKFSPTGQYLGQFGEQTNSWPPAPGQLRVPHGLTILGDGSVCVADRENQRIQCFNPTHGNVTKVSGNFGRVFAVAAYGPRIFGISQPGLTGGQSALFVVDAALNPVEMVDDSAVPLANPHDLALDKSGQLAYVAEIGPNRLLRFAV